MLNFCALFLLTIVTAAAASNDTVVARNLAAKADDSRAAGETVRPYLLYSEAAKLDTANPIYRKKRDSIAGAAELLLKTKLEEADIAEDIKTAQFDAEEEVSREAALAKAIRATAESASAATPPVSLPQPQPAAPDTSTDATDSAASPKEITVPANLSLGLSFRQDSAASAGSPSHLTENRSYAYINLVSDLWSSDDQKSRLQISEQLRAYYDSVFELSYYPAEVRKTEEYQVQMRRLVLSYTAPGWTVHLGRQQVVWGQALGMFIDDLINPKDYTLFLTQDFDDIRIPLWSLDVQRKVSKNSTLELFWSPDVRQSILPTAGSAFTFYTPSISLPVTTNLDKPAMNLANSTMGLRYSWLTDGWDSSVFYLRQRADLPATSTSLLFNQQPVVDVNQLFPELNRFALSTSKPLGEFVFRSEAVFTQGDLYETRNLGSALPRDSVSGMIGISYPLPSQYMLDVQYFQTSLFGPSADLYQPGLRSGVAIRLADVASLRRFKPSLQAVMSPNQHDFWITPKLNVRLVNSLFLIVGANWFGGALDTQFGQFRRASQIETSLLWKAKSY